MRSVTNVVLIQFWSPNKQGWLFLQPWHSTPTDSLALSDVISMYFHIDCHPWFCASSLTLPVRKQTFLSIFLSQSLSIKHHLSSALTVLVLHDFSLIISSWGNSSMFCWQLHSAFVWSTHWKDRFYNLLVIILMLSIFLCICFVTVILK